MRLILGFCVLIVIVAGTLLGFRLSEPDEGARETPAPMELPAPVPAAATVAEDSTDAMQVERIDDRSIRVNDRFVLRGSGTQRDPYAISWEYLASAHEAIDPAKGQTEPAAHIQALDSTWVKIDGYYSTPLATEEVDSVLLTLNRWDGCCIGLPPTPFDCIETSLRNPINMRSKHLIRFGTVTGRMSVEPFVIGNWLMGLYRLEDATLDVGSM